MVSAIWVTNRKAEDYENDLAGMPDKHYQTEEILVEANNGREDDFEDMFKEIIMEESGVRNKADKGKSYYYKSSRLSERGEGQLNDSQDNLPLTQKQSFKKPIS